MAFSSPLKPVPQPARRGGVGGEIAQKGPGKAAGRTRRAATAVEDPAQPGCGLLRTGLAGSADHRA